MTEDHNHPTRSQQIFTLNLPVETVSLYLLCCGLIDEGRKAALKEIKNIWNGSDEALLNALEELENRNIIRKVISDDAGNDIYRVMDAGHWR